MPTRWIPTVLTALVALLCASRPCVAQPRTAADSALDVEREAVMLLQGKGREPFLDSARIRLVARALETVRASVPELRHVRLDGGFYGLYVHPPDSAPTLFGRNSATVRRVGVDSAMRLGLALHDEVKELGVPDLDSLHARLPVRRIHVRSRWSTLVARVEFARPPNYSALAGLYAGLESVRYAYPDVGLQYDGTDISLTDAGRSLHFLFGIGAGDCVLSCISWTYYRATYDTLTRGVTHERLPGSRRRWRSIVADIREWDSVESIAPYPTYDALRWGLMHEEPWRREHAVRLLARVLQPAAHAEGDAADPMRETLLARSVALRRRDAFLLLAQRLADRDPDVAATALDRLQSLTGTSLAGGAAGVAAWRRWIEANVPPR